jgi:hypothetical protein
MHGAHPADQRVRQQNDPERYLANVRDSPNFILKYDYRAGIAYSCPCDA